MPQGIFLSQYKSTFLDIKIQRYDKIIRIKFSAS